MAFGWKRGVGIAAGAMLLIAGLIYLVARPGTEANAEPDKPMVPGFAVIEPVTPEVVEDFSDEVEFRLMTQRFRIRHASKPEPIEGFGTIELPSGRVAHLTTRGEEFCAWIEHGSGNCTDLEHARTGKVYTSSQAGPCSSEITGFVPDGIAYVQVDEGKDGVLDQRWPVTGNVYVGIVKGKKDARITGFDAEGKRFFGVDLPLSFFMMDSSCPGTP